MHREKKRCLAASLLLLCLALLISSLRDYGASPGGTNAGIVWLPLTQTAPPSKVAELRQNILTFLEPFRRKVFGDPDVILTTASFISISPIAQNQNVFPPAASTNTDGTLACVLSADKFFLYQQRIRKIEGMNEFAAPMVTTFERARATLSVSRTALISGTNAPYGQTVDLVHYVNGRNLEMRAIADVTEPVTNVLPATREAPATESVTIRTLFQTALEARIPSGGGVAVWNKAVDANEKTYLLLISPAIQPKPRPKN